jgi:hypothetical protein
MVGLNPKPFGPSIFLAKNAVRAATIFSFCFEISSNVFEITSEKFPFPSNTKLNVG